MATGEEIATTGPRELAYRHELSVEDLIAQVSKIQTVMRQVMRAGEHYGVIPGTGSKPTLLKAGAEKLGLLFRLDPQYEATTDDKDNGHGGHLTVVSKCTLWHIPTGQRIGSGMGSCSTREAKYAYRTAARTCPSCGSSAIIRGKEEYGGGWLCYSKKGGCGKKYSEVDPAIVGQTTGRIANEDLADQYNTVLKMSNKRSLIAATLNATAASDTYTQDLEDTTEPHEVAGHPAATAPAPGSRIIDAPPPDGDGLISEGQAKRLWAIARTAGLAEDDVRRVIGAHGFEKTGEITREAYDKIVNELKKPSA